MQAEEVKAWYDGSARVLNEVDILFGKGLSKRPDRVMIKDNKVIVVDYKFGERQDKRHPNQVRRENTTLNPTANEFSPFGVYPLSSLLWRQ